MTKQSDEPIVDPKTDAEITDDILNNYFEGFRFKCEICDNNKWFSQKFDRGDDAVSYSLKSNVPNDDSYDINSYSLICITCGNTKLINKFIVKYNIRKNRDAMKKIESFGNE